MHTVSFYWFLSGLEWILNLEFCLVKLLLFYQKLLWNTRSRLNSSTFWVFEPLFKYVWSKSSFFLCTKLQFWSKISKYRPKQNSKLRIDFKPHRNQSKLTVCNGNGNIKNSQESDKENNENRQPNADENSQKSATDAEKVIEDFMEIVEDEINFWKKLISILVNWLSILLIIKKVQNPPQKSSRFW